MMMIDTNQSTALDYGAAAGAGWGQNSIELALGGNKLSSLTMYHVDGIE